MDPFQVLGVSPNADEDTIKKAYRNLSKQYHPDNNPGDKNAEERFKMVQAAYEQIMEMRKNGYTAYRDAGSGSDYSSFFGFNAGRNAGSNSSADFNRAVELVRIGAYRDAMNVLNTITLRNGDWYYLAAVCEYNLGNNSVALDHARRAYSMDPSNYNYKDLLDRMEASASRYQARYDGYDHSNSVSDTCCKMIMCNIGLNMCCGGLRC